MSSITAPPATPEDQLAVAQDASLLMAVAALSTLGVLKPHTPLVDGLHWE